MEHNIFLQISILLAVTVSVSFFIRFLKQPLLVAYMITGIICGPLFLNLINEESQIYHALSNFGVALLLFIVGLELNFSYLKKIGKTSLVIGLFQFIFNFAIIFLIANYFFNLSLVGLIFLSLASCFSSTIVTLKLLNDKRDEDSVYGRYTVGVLLIQDLLSIIILFSLSVLYPNQSTTFSYESILKILGVLLFLLVSYKFILKKIIDHIASSSEFLFIFTVTWCFVVASLVVWGGLSMELGAVIAGLTLGSSKYQPEIVSRIKPLRDFFIVIFFIVLGSLADFSNPGAVFIPAIILSLSVIVIKPLILYFLFRLQEFTRRNSFLSALTAIPLSEFGFIILLAALSSGALSGSELSIFTLATIITIFVSSYLINYNAQIYNFLLPFFLMFGKDKYIQKEDSKESFDAMVFGYHRTGWKIGNALKEIGLNFAAVDFNPENVTKLSSHHIKNFFGDISDIEFLKALPLDHVKIIISTVHSPEDQLVMLDYLKTKKNKPTIICTLYNKKYLDRLYEAGADYVMLPHLLSGTWISGLIVDGALSHKRSLQKLRKIQVKELKGSLDHNKIEKIVRFS
jgi:Kef-type K+ transport system membrane component KefB/Trk K+ transport system NAD-binding subunit